MLDEKEPFNALLIWQRAVFLLALNLLTKFPPFVLQASAQPTNKSIAPISDYKAETVEPLYDQNSITPLPVELVEEQEEAENEPLELNQQPKAEQNYSNLDKKEQKKQEEEKVLQEKTTVLNVTDVEISALVKTFSKLTKRNYIVDSGTIKGKVTVHLPSEITVAEALRVFDSILLLKGFTTVPVGDNIWKVIQAKEARQTTIPMLKPGDEVVSDALVTELFRLKHLPAADIQTLITQFVSKDGLVQAVATTNSLVLIDSPSNIKRLKQLISQLDVPALDQEISIIPVLYAEAVDIADKINEILGEDEQKGQQQQGQQFRAQPFQPYLPPRPGVPTQTRPGVPGQPQVGLDGQNKRLLPLKIIPDERTNSLIVVADQETTLKVRALAEQLDSEIDRSGSRFWVYQLKHSDAETLADTLSSLISGSGGSSGGGSTGRPQNSGGLTTNDISGTSGSRNSSNRGSSFSRSRSSSGGSSRAMARSNTGGSSGQGTGGGGRVSLEGEVTIAPDAATNSLIINASRSDYQRIREVIETLDVKRRQVLVEATILEVTLNKEEGMGVELQGTLAWDDGAIMSQTNYSNLTNILSNPTALSDLTIAAASTGTITLPGGIVIPSQAVLISALSKNQNVNVLSTPTILSTDNEEARIVVGENVPFVTSTSADSTNLNSTFNQIERQDVGITLEITPQISSGDFVTLRIWVEISNVVPGTRNDPNGPTTTIRTSETQVEVKNGQMIVTGGLMQDSITDSTRGVPFLQDIPVLGQLFQRQDTLGRRTNLLIFITPRIVSDQFEAREETKQRAQELQNELTKRGIEPERSAVLQNPKMDNVINELPESMDRGPSTIRPPAVNSNGLIIPKDEESEAATRRTLERFKQVGKQEGASSHDINSSQEIEEDSTTEGDFPLSPSQEPSLDNSEPMMNQEDDGFIELKARPPLPQLKSASPGSNNPNRIASSKLVSNQKSVGNETYVVLRAKQTRKNSAESSSSGDTVALVIKGGLVSAPGRSFEVGEKYFRDSLDQQTEYVCIGIYASREEAAMVHPNLANGNLWSVLSTEESLNLGRLSWIRS